MKYVVIDIETTGIDPENNQILEIGAVIEDTKNILPIEDVPKFKCIIRHSSYTGSAYAINMNSRIFNILANESIAQEHNVLSVYQAVENFKNWVIREYFLLNPLATFAFPKPINVAGKNFGVFDKLFLDRFPTWNNTIKWNRRFIDPVMFYVDWDNDESLPDLNTCLKRARIKREVTHNALEDAIDTLLCLRATY